MRQMTPEAVAIESMFRIANKEANDVDFILNTAQRSLDAHIAEVKSKGWPVRMWVPKARQEGVSAYILARFLVKAVTMRNRQCRIMAHDGKATQKLLRRVKYYMKHMKGGHPTIKYDTKSEITFPKTDSSIEIYTAGSEDASRSDTVTDFHGSEAAYWENPKKLAAAAFNTVPLSGEIFLESTGNGAETWYHWGCKDARREAFDAQLEFLPWDEFPEYTLPFDPKTQGNSEGLLDLLQEFEEAELIKNYPHITPGQILWRRMKIRQHYMDIDLFKQEYPMSLGECFRRSTTSFFHKTSHIRSKEWEEIDKSLARLKGHPVRKYHYAMGVDVAAGTGNKDADSSVIQIVCYETGEQVAEWVSKSIAPDEELAREIESLGKIFHWPVLVVESNSFGYATIDNLVDRGNYPIERLFWDGMGITKHLGAGFQSTSQSKHLWYPKLRRQLALGAIVFYSDELMSELSSFTGDLEAAKGCHDDRVTALCMANVALSEIPNMLAAEAPTIYPYDTKDIRTPFPIDERILSEGQPLQLQHSILNY